MRVENITNTNFQGKLVITNHLSEKPEKSVKKVQEIIKNLVQKKDYNIYLTQDYGKNEISIYADYPFPQKPSKHLIFLNTEKENLPLNAKCSRYIDAAKSAIEKYDKALLSNKQKEWGQKRKQDQVQELKGILGAIAIFPLYGINLLLGSIHPKLSKNFEKLLEKII